MNWWHYLLLVNIYLVLFYLFYVLLLHRETYFQLNRIYLVAAGILSFLIPVIQTDWVKELFITAQVHDTLYSGTLIFTNPVITYAFKPIESNALTIGQMLGYLYIAGIAFLSMRLTVQLVSVNRMISTPEPTAAYSFFKKISLGEAMTKDNAILAHEQVHARQWHSLDVLIIEAIMIINWFNPVIYLYRFAIKRTHEFIADQQALKTGADKAEYALLLLSQTFGAPSHQLVNPFYNHSLLKQRIMMLQKNRSQRIVLFKYMLSAPLFGLMLILSSATLNGSNAVNVINKKAGSVFNEPVVTSVSELENNGRIPNGQLPADAGQEVSRKAVAIAEIKSDSNTGDSNVAPSANAVYESVEKEPGFPGGIEKFYAFLSSTVKYPADARRDNISGKVFVQFIIERDGSLTDIKAVRGPGQGLNEEAVRALSLSPKWNPGIQNGVAVRVQYTVPVNFTLSDDAAPAQTIQKDNRVYESVEKEPTFPGGIDGFYNYLINTVKYPANARKEKIEGKVFVQFTIEKDGSIREVKSVRGPGHGLDEEAVKAIEASPKWKSGMQNGQLVRVRYTVPVNFTLSGNPSSRAAAGKRPLFVIDGVISDRSKAIPGNIKSKKWISGDPAVALYGEKARGGVMVISTKNEK